MSNPNDMPICPSKLCYLVSRECPERQKKSIREKLYSDTKGNNFKKYSFIIAEVKMKHPNVSETTSHLTYEIIGSS